MCQYKQTITYHATIKLPVFGGYVFNHGTEGKLGQRTNQHIADCKSQGLTYDLIEEKSDRLYGTNVIAPSFDSEFVKRVVDRLNKTVLAKSDRKAMTFKDWNASLKVLSSIERGYYEALRKSDLSETECCFIPELVTEDQLAEAVKYVEDTWYYTVKSLRVSAKPYKEKTDDEKKMAAKPIPEKLHARCLAMAASGRKFAKLLSYRKAYVQSILLAWTIANKACYHNIQTIIVIVTGDDKDKYKTLYDIMKSDPRFEIKDCESDLDVAEEYNNMDIKTDLIIANPPYGAIGANIADFIRQNIDYKDYVNLLPANDYKRNKTKDLFKYARDMEPVNNAFADAAVTTHLAKIVKEASSITLDEFERSQYTDRNLDKYFLVNRIKAHYALDEAELSGATDAQFKLFSVDTTVLFGSRDVHNGHLPYSKTTDTYKYNVEKSVDNTYIFEHRKATRGTTYDGWLHVAGVTFKTAAEKNNFVSFIYSQDGFRFLAKVFKAINIDGTINCGKVFPKVDWTRSWTVEEILKDYGYSDKEVKEVMDDLVNFKGMDN